MTDAEIYKARRQGKLDGLRTAAAAMCDECKAGDVPELQDTAQAGPCWFHRERDPNAIYRNGCDAGPIQTLIAKDWGTTKPEAERTNHDA